MDTLPARPLCIENQYPYMFALRPLPRSVGLVDKRSILSISVSLPTVFILESHFLDLRCSLPVELPK